MDNEIGTGSGGRELVLGLTAQGLGLGLGEKEEVGIDYEKRLGLETGKDGKN